MTQAEELYRLGFFDKCAELGVDPEALIKWAQGRAYNPSVAASTKEKARQAALGGVGLSGLAGPAAMAANLRRSPTGILLGKQPSAPTGPAGGTLMAPAGVGKGRAFNPELAKQTKRKATGAGVGSAAKSLSSGTVGGAALGAVGRRLGLGR